MTPDARVGIILNKLMAGQINATQARLRIMALSYTFPDIKTLRKRRESVGVSVREMERLTGISRTTISEVERGANARFETVKVIHQKLVELETS